MQNVEIKVEENKLIIVVDLEKEIGESSSGKTILVASTRGNHPVMHKEKQFMVGLNVYRYKEKR